MFHGPTPIHITLDCGAIGNLISTDTARRIGARVVKTSQGANQADGNSPLRVVGETALTFTMSESDKVFHFEGLVIDDLDGDVLGGVPFMAQNDISVRPAKHQIILGDNTSITYPHTDQERPALRRAVVLRGGSKSTTVWPGDFLELNIPPTSGVVRDQSYIIEARYDSHHKCDNGQWPPTGIVTSVGHSIRLTNDTPMPIVVKKNSYFCQVREVSCTPVTDNPPNDSNHVPPASPPSVPSQASVPSTCVPHNVCTSAPYLSVSIDPDDCLTPSYRQLFLSTNEEFQSVFTTNDKVYNGKSGPVKSIVNMGPVLPPQRKGKMPLYGRNRLVELQSKFDDLERQGVFARPEDIGVSVEYLNPSFLVNKPGGGTRLVTAFSDVGRYCKPQPSLLPDVDSTLRTIAGWKWLIQTDLKSAFYQIPLDRNSMKYCGVATPFCSTRVYQRCAMGMPGSETTLEELMCRVLGNLLVEGRVTKLADDIYIGGDSPSELLSNWRQFLQVLTDNNLGISAAKTVIAPSTSVILGWVWQRGTLTASQHRLSTLATCDQPKTVKNMRAYIGAYKVISRVLPHCAHILSPLEDAISGSDSKDKIQWTPELEYAFKHAQSNISSADTITLPRSSDMLWIVTDAAVKTIGLAATLYTTRAGKLHLAGHFSAKLKQHQRNWLPCELKALAITAAVKHFSPYIIQSKYNACVLTDSKPCVQAAEKLCRGEFSTSPRVATFLSNVSRYQVSIRHLPGSANVPSDFGSRNAPPCCLEKCGICAFIKVSQDATVLKTNINDVISGASRLPFASRRSWYDIQSSCPDLRRTHAHLKQGTRPSKKITNAADVKRYLRVVTIAGDGLLVVPQQEVLSGSRECIIVPRQILNGLVMALHLQLDHPSAHQLQKVMRWSFFALDLDRCIKTTTELCHQCAALRQIPKTVVEQSTGDPPAAVGVTFSADVLRRNRQIIIVLRESVTSYTLACFIDNEQHPTLREAIIKLTKSFIPLAGPPAVIRTDPGTGFCALTNDDLLSHHRVHVEIGPHKNTNKNPEAERAVQELEAEILKQDPLGGAITDLTLTLAVSRLNKRIRGRGLSSWEMWTHRDMYHNTEIPVSDLHLIESQHQSR